MQFTGELCFVAVVIAQCPCDCNAAVLIAICLLVVNFSEAVTIASMKTSNGSHRFVKQQHAFILTFLLNKPAKLANVFVIISGSKRFWYST